MPFQVHARRGRVRGLTTTDRSSRGRRAPRRRPRAAVLLPEGGVGARRRAAARVAPHTRIVTIDTGVLFPETLRDLARLRGALRRRRSRSRSAYGDLDRPEHCCGDGEGRRARAGARRRRRRGSPASAASSRRRARDAAARRVRRARAACGSTTRSPTGPSATCGARIHERDLPYHPLHDPATTRSAARRARSPGAGREGRWAGTEKLECGLHVGDVEARRSPTWHALEAEAIHVMREVAAELEQPVLLFSGGKDSIVLLRLAEKAFRPGRFPFPLMHVDTGHNFPEVIEFRDRRVAELGERLDRRLRAGVDRPRARRRGDRPARVAQPAADDDAARRDRRARLRRGLRRRAPRRGARAGQGAHLLLPRRLRRLGPAPPAPRAVEPLQRPHPPRRARPRRSR